MSFTYWVEPKMRIVGEGISKYYRNGKVATKGLDGVDIVLNNGDFALLTGASGSGKSTLAKALALQISYDEGDIYFDERKEFSLSDKERQKLKSSDLAYISPSDSFIESLSPLDNLLLQASGAYESKRKLRKIAKETLISLGLKNVMHRKVSLLSGGERDRVAIALSLILPASVFFFDEPLSDLNPALKELCLKKILEKTKGKTVLFITHDPELVEKYASCHYKMESGKIVSKTVYPKSGPDTLEAKTHEKVYGFTPIYLFKGKRFRIFASVGICFLLGVFLVALGHLGSSIYRDNVNEERWTYLFSTHFPNRMVVNGSDVATIGTQDVGDLFGEIYVTSSYENDDGRTYALPSSSIQPILPIGNPTIGEKDEEGCYFLMSKSSYGEKNANHAYIENAIGKTISIYDSENYHRKAHPHLAEATLKGIYVLDDSSFYLGSDCSLYVSPGVLSEMRGSLIERLNDESNSFSDVSAPLYSSGLSSSGGMILRSGEKTLSSLSDAAFSSYPTRYESSSGEALEPGKIYLPSDMEGEDFSFSYKGSVIESKDVEGYIRYMGWPLKNGEWHVSSATLRKISMEMNLESSIYFSSAQEMRSFESGASGITYRHGDDKTLLSEASLDILNTVWLVFIGLAGLGFSLLSSWLLRKIYKAREEDARVLMGRGYSPCYLAIMESLSYAILSVLAVSICFFAYFMWLGGTAISPFIPLFILLASFAIIGVAIPVGEKKFRRI